MVGPFILYQVVTSVVDVPEEVCDLNPAKVCRFTTRLVPSLTPDQQCTVVPKAGGQQGVVGHRITC
jgi:hypothetical protein